MKSPEVPGVTLMTQSHYTTNSQYIYHTASLVRPLSGLRRVAASTVKRIAQPTPFVPTEFWVQRRIQLSSLSVIFGIISFMQYSAGF